MQGDLVAVGRERRVTFETGHRRDGYYFKLRQIRICMVTASRQIPIAKRKTNDSPTAIHRAFVVSPLRVFGGGSAGVGAFGCRRGDEPISATRESLYKPGFVGSGPPTPLES